MWAGPSQGQVLDHVTEPSTVSYQGMPLGCSTSFPPVADTVWRGALGPFKGCPQTSELYGTVGKGAGGAVSQMPFLPPPGKASESTQHAQLSAMGLAPGAPRES